MSNHPSDPSQSSSSPSREAIERRAFELWEQSGRPEGHSEEHWHQAERELCNNGETTAPVEKNTEGTTASAEKEAGKSSAGFENSWQGGSAAQQEGASEAPAARSSNPKARRR
ncbi:MAG: DUF2934 domain-containing protein [Opitutaceae bacterium]